MGGQHGSFLTLAGTSTLNFSMGNGFFAEYYIVENILGTKSYSTFS